MKFGFKLSRLATPTILCLWAGLASAEVSVSDTNACITESLNQGRQATSCIALAHSSCTEVVSETPAVATLCFVNAERAWAAGISGIMSQITEGASEEIAAIASIESKYDLLTALLQCDRMEELELVVGQKEDEDILLGNAHCKARATALTYARLFVRSRDLN